MSSDLPTTVAITVIVGIPTAWIGTLAFPGLTRAASDRWARRSRAASARHADRLTRELGLLRHLHHHDRELFLTILGNLHVLVLLCTLLLLSVMVVASVVANADAHGRTVGYAVLVAYVLVSNPVSIAIWFLGNRSRKLCSISAEMGRLERRITEFREDAAAG